MDQPIYILGINTSHDRAACLVCDGEVLCQISEERLDRNKHSIQPDAEGNYLCTLPQLSIKYCLEVGGIQINDVAKIIVSSSVVYHPQNPLRNMTLEDVLPQFTDLEDKTKVEILNHHLAHAAGAFFASPFAEAAVMVVDGGGNIVGEKPPGPFKMPPVEHATLYHAKDNRLSELLKICSRPKSLNSLGALYNLITQFVGFGQFNEGKTMGLAPFGADRFYSEFKKAVRVLDSGGYEIHPDFQPFDWRGRFFKSGFLKRFGQPNQPGKELRASDRDLAFAVQKVLEETLVEMAGRLQKKTGAKNLCIAGGVGLNSVANKKILDRTDFEEIFIIPAAADDGCAIGGALWGWHQEPDRPRKYVMKHAYLGRAYDEDEISEALTEFKKSVTWRRSENIAAETAKLMADGQIVGWHQEGSEAGPRALGHRSIICDPRRQEMVDILNSKVKHREGFRPFAPVVPLEQVKKYFDLDCASPFMLLIAGVKQPDVVPAITHVDQTGRVQTVTKEDNGLFYDLVIEFEKLTGVAVILNTSFNIAGDPIVETPQDSLECFVSTRIDYLVIGDYLIEKINPEIAHTIADLRKQTRRQQQQIQVMDAELESIRQSRGWQLLARLNRIRDLVLRRRKRVDFL